MVHEEDLKTTNNRDSPSGLFLVEDRFWESLLAVPFLMGEVRLIAKT